MLLSGVFAIFKSNRYVVDSYDIKNSTWLSFIKYYVGSVVMKKNLVIWIKVLHGINIVFNSIFVLP